MSDAFSLDIDRCTGCYACAVACMDQNDLDTAEARQAWRTVFTVGGRGVSGGEPALRLARLHAL